MPYISLSQRARTKATQILRTDLPWIQVPRWVARHATGGVALVTEAQYAQIQHLPGVRKLHRDPWQRRPQQETLL